MRLWRRIRAAACASPLGAAALLAACGGGDSGRDDGRAAPAAATAPSSTQAGFNDRGEVAGNLDTPAALAAARESAKAVTIADGTQNASSSFDEAFTTFAAGWFLNWWGTLPSYSAGRESVRVYAGTGSQRLRLGTLVSGSGAHMVFPYGFVNGSSYQASLWLRADAAMTVEVQLRRDVSPWNLMDSQRLSVGMSALAAVMSRGFIA